MILRIVLILCYSSINVVLVKRAATSQSTGRTSERAPWIRLVALGEQAMSRWRQNLMMHCRSIAVSQYETSKPVHVTNVSVGGATVQDIVDHQLLEADLSEADLIIVATASDLEGRVPVDEYRANLHTLLGALPPEKTIFSDLPIEPGRDDYQAIFQQAADERGIKRADFAQVFNGEGRRLDVFSWLFPHLNSTGYYYWFLAFKPKVDQVMDSRESGS
jgi:hypothetical protein